jgi:hypothetical protein
VANYPIGLYFFPSLDPWIWDKHWDLILQEIKKEYPPIKEEDYTLNYSRLDRELGPKKFGDICKRVRDPLTQELILEKKKYGERWIQVK